MFLVIQFQHFEYESEIEWSGIGRYLYLSYIWNCQLRNSVAVLPINSVPMEFGLFRKAYEDESFVSNEYITVIGLVGL